MIGGNRDGLADSACWHEAVEQSSAAARPRERQPAGRKSQATHAHMCDMQRGGSGTETSATRSRPQRGRLGTGRRRAVAPEKTTRAST